MTLLGGFALFIVLPILLGIAFVLLRRAWQHH